MQLPFNLKVTQSCGLAALLVAALAACTQVQFFFQ
jgi:hypothetical protein